MNAFGALADPTRAGIVEALAEEGRTVNEIVSLFSLTQPSISRHLRILRRVGLEVAPRRDVVVGKLIFELDLRTLDRADCCQLVPAGVGLGARKCELVSLSPTRGRTCELERVGTLPRRLRERQPGRALSAVD